MSVETLEVNTTNYTLEVTNGTTQTLEVTEGVTLDLLLSEMGLQGPAGPAGKSISSVVKTSTVGLVDTYTITFSDNTTQTFTVTNGADGSDGIDGVNGRGIVSITRTSGTGAAGTTDTYTITYTDSTTSTFTVYNGANGTGSVSSVGLSVPTGLTVSNSPITTSGTIAVTYTAGYSIPTTAKQSNWDTAYGWGNHATAGYLTSAAIGSTVQAYDAELTEWASIAPSTKQDTLVSGTNIRTINGTTLMGSGNITTGDVTLNTAQTLTNKTISVDSNTISGISASSFVLSNVSGNIDGSLAQKSIPAGVVVGTTDTQTLTNKTLSTGSEWQGNVVSVTYGGTGRNSLTTGNVIIGNGASGVNFVAPGASGNVLQSNGTAWVSSTPPSSLSGYTESSNTALGVSALDSVTTGTQNTALGVSAATALSSGADNVVIGYSAGSSITTAGANVIIGASAAVSDTSFFNSVIIGKEASNRTESNFSVLIGYRAGWGASTTSSLNNCVGVGYGVFNSCGSNAQHSVAVGLNALYSLDAVGNIGIGTSAGFQLSTGTYNTLVGHSAGYTGTNNLTTGSNNTLIGYNAAPTSSTVSNQITLGNSSISTLRCQVTTITSLSDVRDKTDIQELDAGLSFINKLKPVRFIWNMRDGGKVGEVDTGFIAQDLKAVQEETGNIIPGLVLEDNSEKLEAGYGKLLPVLVKAIQDLSAEVKELQAKLEEKNV